MAFSVLAVAEWSSKSTGSVFEVCCFTLCYAIVPPGHKSAFRAGFWPACDRESTEMGPPAGRRPAGGHISVLSRWQSGQIRSGRPTYGPEALLRNIE